MIVVRAALVLSLLIAIAAGSIARQSPAAAQSHAAYIALGDSIAFGVGSSIPERRGYPALLREFLEAHSGETIALVNLAMPGETAGSFMTDGQLDRFSQTVADLDEQRTPLALVTVSLGGNEMLAQRYSSTIERQQALASFRGTLDEALERIRGEVGGNPELVLTTYYDLSEGDASQSSSDAWWIEEFNQVIRETAGRYDAQVAEVDVAFRGQIQELTLHPYDVHPRNQGYRAIAQQVWRALAWDTDAPEIRVLSQSTAMRRTPTLQFEVTDDVGVTAVSVRIGNLPPISPVHIGDGRYVLLLDLRDDDSSEYVIVIDAEDGAGNSSQAEMRLIIEAN